MVGSNARKHFVKGYLTGWASNPLTRGAYSAARPGHYQARIDLARSLHKRLYFAGEAASPDYPALCGGAYITGETAAREVIGAFS
jgi:monoamine oxidase